MHSNGILPSQFRQSRTRLPERVRTTEVGMLLMTAISYVNDEVYLNLRFRWQAPFEVDDPSGSRV
jgi:hypothetical protein